MVCLPCFELNSRRPLNDSRVRSTGVRDIGGMEWNQYNNTYISFMS
jgi:hypothetical protein